MMSEATRHGATARALWASVTPLLAVVVFARANDAKASDEAADYLTHVKPILAQHCYACHGGLKQESGLRLDTAALALKGGESGPAIEPGNPDVSLLINRVTSADESERMPAEALLLMFLRDESINRISHPD